PEHWIGILNTGENMKTAIHVLIAASILALGSVTPAFAEQICNQNGNTIVCSGDDGTTVTTINGNTTVTSGPGGTTVSTVNGNTTVTSGPNGTVVCTHNGNTTVCS